MASVRTEAVAGTFYPKDPKELEHVLRHFLTDAQTRLGPPSMDTPKALVAPHAGYVYSGAVAASAYLKVMPARGRIKRVILLGPCHKVAVRGLALCHADAYNSPFGSTMIDQACNEQLAKLSFVDYVDATHIPEHSLEVHLPFLQAILGAFKLVPIVVGSASPEEVAQALDLVWGGPETLIVISTDLSHYLGYDDCVALDHKTQQAIEQFDIAHIGDSQACGRMPLKGLLQLAKAKNLHIETLDVRNSGDTAGPKDRVVGYGSWALYEQKPQHKTSPNDDFASATKAILAAHGKDLITLAAHSILNGIDRQTALIPAPESLPDLLLKDGAAFVTLHKNHQLRGCIGSLQAWQPLFKDVAENAFKAAFKDPRFPPVKGDELPAIDIHISVLSPATEMTISSEQDLLNQLRPTIDGLIIQDLGKRALFLPSVWESLPDKKQFLAHLKQKAGLAINHWSPSFKAWRFITEGVSSNDLDDPATLWHKS